MENLKSLKKTGVKNWFVVYTKPRWEKKVNQLLQIQGITSFCPLRKVKSQWADRVKIIEVPLFNSYVFVNITPKEELKVRMTLGVMNFIYYMGKPAKISENVIESINYFLARYPEAEVVSWPKMEIGDRVKIKDGLMTQKCGEIIRLSGTDVLVVIDSLNCAMVTKVTISDLELIN